MSLPTLALRRTTSLTNTTLPITSTITHQIRHATLLKRPLRPYTFTQLVTLSDGSTYLTRSTSPAPIYRSTKDTRNHPLWQPSLDSLRNVENDEAGRLSAFRERFGRGWDGDMEKGEGEGGKKSAGESGNGEEMGDMDNLMDLISGGTQRDSASMKGAVRTKSGKEKK
ncbi:f99dac3a-875f-4fa5-a1c6-6edf66aeabc0 [Sclerotinia trifoliorum]|uniref:F99dac3a-875f-4fa5-a1c6-6edf66aeabc0 n=1 Tax=Sclerotinia trifoliorum TaxID=28548 RepID=A0A8H2VPY7_9HELO|nr:f99dac3a-875f-4fa5-a1c6-6edf66aeabc0 [Sclerotinia trifoliorum]